MELSLGVHPYDLHPRTRSSRSAPFTNASNARVHTACYPYSRPLITATAACAHHEHRLVHCLHAVVLLCAPDAHDIQRRRLHRCQAARLVSGDTVALGTHFDDLLPPAQLENRPIWGLPTPQCPHVFAYRAKTRPPTNASSSSVAHPPVASTVSS